MNWLFVPQEIDANKWAKSGYICVGVNKIKCISCNHKVLIPNLTPSSWHSSSLHHLNSKILHGHKPTCSFYLSDKTSKTSLKNIEFSTSKTHNHSPFNITPNETYSIPSSLIINLDSSNFSNSVQSYILSLLPEIDKQHSWSSPIRSSNQAQQESNSFISPSFKSPVSKQQLWVSDDFQDTPLKIRKKSCKSKRIQ